MQGADAGETGALIGADGRDSHHITISQLFTCLRLWQLREMEICAVEIICLHVSLGVFYVRCVW